MTSECDQDNEKITFQIACTVDKKLRTVITYNSDLLQDDENGHTERLLGNLEGFQVNSFPCWVEVPNMGLESPVNKKFVTRWTSIVDGPHVLAPHVSFHLCLFFTSLATDQAYKAHVPQSSLELHQRFHIIILGHI